jgi:CRP/FNR family transcriptional regulator, cyclic AMP receptor protein
MVALLELDPDLANFLTAEERVVADKLMLRVGKLGGGSEGADVDALLAREQAFGAIVVRGILVHQLRVADQLGLRLLGPGDIVMHASDARLMVLADSHLTATTDATLALLDDALLFAVRRWPVLALRLLERFAEQSETLAAQFVIAQLPRVDQRVFALLWLLAERWGRVTSNGTYLPVNLTHQMLGGLIGARRPTVTLALTQLTDRGALIRQQLGWMLIEPPAQPAGSISSDTSTPTLDTETSVWHEQPEPRAHPAPPLERHRLITLEECQAAHASAVRQRHRAMLLRQRSLELKANLVTTAAASSRPRPPRTSQRS